MANGDKERARDRHNIPNPTAGQGKAATATGAYSADVVSYAGFVDGLKERVHELFLTLPGLPGHVVQVQQELNRLSNSALSAAEKLLVADKTFSQIQKAAENCSIDFAEQVFTVASSPVLQDLAHRRDGEGVYRLRAVAVAAERGVYKCADGR
jgi:hypothetical protein